MYIKKLVKKAVLELSGVENFSYIDEVYSSLKNKPCKRWVLMLPGSGCQWAKDTNGCSMCGFKHRLDQLKGQKMLRGKILLAYYLGRYLAKIAHEKPYFLAIYNGGSYLNDKEIPRSLQLKILQSVVSKYPSIKDILIESRPEFITLKNIKELQTILKNQSLIIGIGLECQSDHIRQKLIHKGFTRREYEQTVTLLKTAEVNILTYVFLKPILLNERQAIEEAVATIKYAFNCGSKIVALQSAFIQEGTLMCRFYKCGQYKPPWLWSIIEVVQRSVEYGPIHIGGFQDEPPPIAVPRNCPACSDRVMKAISTYNKTHDISVLQSLHCECQKEWRKEI